MVAPGGLVGGQEVGGYPRSQQPGLHGMQQGPAEWWEEGQAWAEAGVQLAVDSLFAFHRVCSNTLVLLLTGFMLLVSLQYLSLVSEPPDLRFSCGFI